MKMVFCANYINVVQLYVARKEYMLNRIIASESQQLLKTLFYNHL